MAKNRTQTNPYIILERAGEQIALAAGRALEEIIDDDAREIRLQAIEDAQDILGWAQGLIATEHAQALAEFWTEDEPGFDKVPQGVLPYLI